MRRVSARPDGARGDVVRAVRGLGGRLGALRQAWRSRSFDGRDVTLLMAGHLEVMEAHRAMFASTGRDSCTHGVLTGGPACVPCLFGEDARQTAQARAIRDVMRFGGWGVPEAWSQARARVCGVTVAV
ncbi:hypothetical protein [Catenulispora yoronensis]